MTFKRIIPKFHGFFLRSSIMSKVCEICGKKPIYGNNVSHAHNKTRRRWEPNLQKMRIEINGSVRTARVCTSCLKNGYVKKAV